MSESEHIYHTGITVDGQPLALRLAGASAELVRSTLRAHWSAGETQAYQLADGREHHIR